MKTTVNRGHFYRAVFAHAFADSVAGKTAFPADIAASRFRGDESTAALIRASASPMGTADHAGLVSTATGDFLSHLSGSAASALMREALSIPMGRHDSINVPHGELGIDPVWTASSEPITVVSASTGALTINSRKVALIVVTSRELLRGPGGEAAFGHMLRRAASRALDQVVFATTDPGPAGVPGLLHAATPIDAAPLADLAEVLAALTAGLAEAGGSGQVFVAANPALAARIQIEHPSLPWTVSPSRALPVGTMVAVDPLQTAFGHGDVFEVTRETTAALSMRDDPAEIVAEGGSTTDPVRSTWQTDSIAHRLILDVGFAAAPGAAAFCEGVV